MWGLKFLIFSADSHILSALSPIFLLCSSLSFPTFSSSLFPTSLIWLHALSGAGSRPVLGYFPQNSPPLLPPQYHGSCHQDISLYINLQGGLCSFRTEAGHGPWDALAGKGALRLPRFLLCHGTREQLGIPMFPLAAQLLPLLQGRKSLSPKLMTLASLNLLRVILEQRNWNLWRPGVLKALIPEVYTQELMVLLVDPSCGVKAT